jgi:hypothetical protein
VMRVPSMACLDSMRLARCDVPRCGVPSLEGAFSDAGARVSPMPCPRGRARLGASGCAEAGVAVDGVSRLDASASLRVPLTAACARCVYPRYSLPPLTSILRESIVTSLDSASRQRAARPRARGCSAATRVARDDRASTALLARWQAPLRRRVRTERARRGAPRARGSRESRSRHPRGWSRRTSRAFAFSQDVVDNGRSPAFPGVPRRSPAFPGVPRRSPAFSGVLRRSGARALGHSGARAQAARTARARACRVRRA